MINLEETSNQEYVVEEVNERNLGRVELQLPENSLQGVYELEQEEAKKIIKWLNYSIYSSYISIFSTLFFLGMNF